MIIFCHGTDSFRINQRVNELKNHFAQKYPGSIEEFDSSVSWEKLHQALFTFGFLASKRMVVLSGLLADGKNEKAVSGLLNSYDKLDQDERITLLIVETREMSKKKEVKKLFEKLSKGKYSYKFENLNQSQITSWISSEFNKRKGEVDQAVITKLAQNYGNDLWQISNLIDILIAYKDGQKIELKDLEKFMTHKVDDNIFNLVDAIVLGQERKGLELVSGQLNSGISEGYLMTMIERQFGILILLRNEIDKGGFIQSKDLAKKLKLHPYVVQKGLVQANQYSLDRLKEVYRNLVNIDSKLKRSGDPAFLLSLLVIKK